ncbi:beta-galactosidase [Arthrobacter stackebrandtii]|uniref:Beta-galactosidase n=1 Tax=Arthrobacter stackebrandtii TaxID=272161 RepID=A0ABS4YVV7_9MICC|nr:beta-galactosidase [Arthrobacter stackebrandtii]MBP2412927.1 beta-galactosidase [Arthrobacter stackebrandtii]PYH01271.1 beta-galactosidase [Arthrobacter stackebrandtii]
MTDVLSRHLQEPSAAPAAAPAPWPSGPGKIRYGGDYNPEQWSRETWVEDISLMQEAGINLVSIGIFSWVLLEPSEDRYEFGWLDELMDLLGGAGIGVDLGTPTAAPPAWFWKKYPQALPVTRDGVRLGGGSRGMASPSSPEYRRAATAIAEQLAVRYGSHPALVMWHVHNEYGAPVSESYDDASVEAFRIWLQKRYGTLDDLNEAWGTTFWGQRYGQWDEIDAPRTSASVTNQTQRLDFRRFTSDALLQCFIAERNVLRAHTPDIPITTNFMSTNCLSADYWAWSREVDIVSNDHYLVAQREDNHILLSMDADLTRSFAGNRPWILMEHSTSAVNWQGRNIAKRAGEMARNSTAHVARGADAIMFFQFRAARYGAEKFHSTMLPQAGRNSRIWREVVALGESLDTLSVVRGSTVKARVALLWDVESFWAMDLEWRPSDDLDHRERIEAFYSELWKQGVTVDFAHPAQDLSQYDLVIAPSLYMVGAAAEANLRSYVEGGGHLLVSYFSGIVDANDSVPSGAYPGALRDILGLEIHEFLPLRLDQPAALDNGTSGTVWSEEIHAGTAQVLASFAGGPAAGGPALTRNRLGAGAVWYVATKLEGGDLAKLLSDVVRGAGLEPVDGLPDGLEVVTRSNAGENFTFLINHADVDAPFNGRGTDLLTGEEIAATVVVPAGGIRVLHEQ